MYSLGMHTASYTKLVQVKNFYIWILLLGRTIQAWTYTPKLSLCCSLSPNSIFYIFLDNYFWRACNEYIGCGCCVNPTDWKNNQVFCWKTWMVMFSIKMLQVAWPWLLALSKLNIWCENKSLHFKGSVCLIGG